MYPALSLRLGIVLYTAALAISTLYAPQPLLALFHEEFGVSREQSGLLLTVTLIPLSIAPVVYGFILESVPAERVLYIGVILLALVQLPFIWTDQFGVLILSRFLQGLLIPAILTALMAYLSSQAESVRGGMALYVAATIVGGLAGRFITGFAASFLNWRAGFALLSIGWCIALFGLGRLHATDRLHLARPGLHEIGDLLRQAFYIRIYGAIFLVFFCFASVLNVLPLYLSSFGLSSFAISLAYSGYLAGLAMTFGAVKWVRGHEYGALRWGMVIYLTSIPLFALPGFLSPYPAMFFFCGAMFFVHTLLSGLLNRTAQRRGIAGGLYVSAYYSGGSLGSYLPGLVYLNIGWKPYLLCLGFIVLLAWLAVAGLRPDGTEG